MSLLDNDLDLNIDSMALVNIILNYIKDNTFLNPHIKWNIVVDDITDYMNNPESYYLYHTGAHDYDIYIYSSMYIISDNTFPIVNKRYKHINLKLIMDYESAR